LGTPKEGRIVICVIIFLAPKNGKPSLFLCFSPFLLKLN